MQNNLTALQEKVDELEKRVTKLEGLVIVPDDDVLLEQAVETLKGYDMVSASLLQRRLRIGYARAARLLDILEEKGIVGPGEGAKPRKVLIKKEKG